MDNASGSIQVVAYARVSSKEQEKEGYSIPAQLRLLKEYARKNGFKIIKEFIDVETAKVLGRHQFGEMIKFLKANEGYKRYFSRENGPAI